MQNLFDRVTIDSIVASYEDLGYPLFTNGNYNINFGAVRSKIIEADSFDDVFYMLYNENQDTILFKFYGTTDPGKHWLRNLMDPGGAAIVKEGYYRGLWELSTFKGMPCLRQRTSIKIYRDANKDNILNMQPHNVTEGWYGILFHCHFQNSVVATAVGASSAGCQVPKSYAEYSKAINIFRKSASFYGNKFSYGLLKEEQLLAI